MKICNMCGSNLNDNDRFCSKCGNSNIQNISHQQNMIYPQQFNQQFQNQNIQQPMYGNWQYNQNTMGVQP